MMIERVKNRLDEGKHQIYLCSEETNVCHFNPNPVVLFYLRKQYSVVAGVPLDVLEEYLKENYCQDSTQSPSRPDKAVKTSNVEDSH